MASPFIGEIKMFAGTFAPLGWAFCAGQLLPIGDYDALYNLIGTTYGGDGQTTFALPDLRGRVPVHPGNGIIQGETGGAESITLTVNQVPAHSHTAKANSATGNSTNPGGNYWAAQPAFLPYSPAGSENVNMKAGAIGLTGNNQPHDNMIPFTCLNYVIALEGIYPTQG